MSSLFCVGHRVAWAEPCSAGRPRKAAPNLDTIYGVRRRCKPLPVVYRRSGPVHRACLKRSFIAARPGASGTALSTIRRQASVLAGPTDGSERRRRRQALSAAKGLPRLDSATRAFSPKRSCGRAREIRPLIKGPGQLRKPRENTEQASRGVGARPASRSLFRGHLFAPVRCVRVRQRM